MFGYVRPEKELLLMRDFTRYRSVYCGLCKTIKERYGNLQRSVVTYDMTFLALLLLSLSLEDSEIVQEGCVLNPLKKKPISKHHAALDFAADSSIILAYYSALDNARDERPFLGRAQSLLLRRSGRKASRLYPDLSANIAASLRELNDIEKGDYDPSAADIFGRLLAELFAEGARLLDHPDRDMLIRVLPEVGFALGKWIYLMDAFDDREDDLHNKQWNPLLKFSEPDSRIFVEEKLKECEEEVDRLLALLPYQRDGAIVGNVATIGLSRTRERILAGVELPRL
ncbi:MAG: DUF5685 family protein [Eubacteriales bacterium]|nr:DUF5685 family protein [Eubacteriales bacterium]MDD4323824.1 DUF5685 family protein [Eubacteriales bacterium]MDD4540791.1 DUF5685 family protein [Eubacteriales bacterium]